MRSPFSFSIKPQRSVTFNPVAAHVQLPKILLAQCALCGAAFPQTNRLLCWRHHEALRGPARNDVSPDDITQPGV